MDAHIRYRLASVDDREKLDEFLSFEYFVHRHLDWRKSLDWLGSQPFWIAEINREIIAAYAAPPEPETAAWVRLFACNATFSRLRIWEELFQRSLSQYQGSVESIAALGIENWFINMLGESRFEYFQDVIVLEWQSKKWQPMENNCKENLRPMNKADLPKVANLDKLCFPPIWQLPLTAMHSAFDQSDYATVIETNGNIIAYQISTSSLSAAHLARIAVSPQEQGKSLGHHLLDNLIAHYKKIGVRQITVNTQHDNLASQALYKKAGFIPIGEKYPVFVYPLG